MENIINVLIDIQEYAKFRDNALETAEYIAELDGETLDILKGLFSVLDVEEDDEYEYIYKISEDMDSLIEEIDEYVNFRMAERYENGEDLFKRHVGEDRNKYYADEDDLLEEDWEDIFALSDDLETSQNGCLMYATRQSEKKDRSQVIWKDGDLEGGFVDVIEG